MNAFSTIRNELQYNFGNLKRMIPILAIMFIPIMYAGTFLWAFWNPYGHLDRLPVAVVNEDQGATFQGKTINAGQDLENNLRKDDSLGWNFVNASQANQGFENNHYYMILTIPKNFSQEAANAATKPGAPEPKLISKTNDRHNYIAGIIGRNAMVKLQEQTAGQLAKTYAQNLVTGLTKLESGFNSAERGASQIATGAGSLTQNSGSLVNGATSLVNGSNSLLQATNSAENGAKQVTSGVVKSQQATQQLAHGLGQLGVGAKQLQQSTGILTSSATQLAQGLTSASGGSKQLASGAQSLANGMAAFEKADPQLAQSPQFQQLVQASQQVASGSAQVAAVNAKLQSGATALASGAEKLNSGMGTFADELGSAQSAAQNVATSERQLVSGAKALQSGLSQLTVGESKLQTGAQSLASGVKAYTGGASKVASGAQNLAQKMKSATGAMPTVYKSQVVSAIANPVGLSQQQTGGITDYGNGFAPYFISLGLYVGALLMSIVITFRDAPDRPSSGFAWFLSKTVLVGGVAVVQSLIADAILLLGLGVHANHPWAFVLFSLLSSLMFVSIIQFFVSTMQNPGRYLAVIVMILQLTTSSGSYPVLLSPPFFQHLAPYLPMDYTVDGYRFLIGGGKASFMTSDVWHLVAYWIVFLALTCTFFILRHRRVYRSDTGVASASLQA